MEWNFFDLIGSSVAKVLILPRKMGIARAKLPSFWSWSLSGGESWTSVLFPSNSAYARLLLNPFEVASHRNWNARQSKEGNFLFGLGLNKFLQSNNRMNPMNGTNFVLNCIEAQTVDGNHLFGMIGKRHWFFVRKGHYCWQPSRA